MPSRLSLLPQMARLFAAQARLYYLSALFPGLLGVAALTAVSLYMLRGVSDPHVDSRDLWSAMPVRQQLISIVGLIFSLWTPILLAARAVCRITAEQLSGRAINLSLVLLDLARFLPAALFYSPVIGIPSMIGGTIFFVPGMVVASLFALVVPVTVNENPALIPALKRGFVLGGHVFIKNLIIVLAGGGAVGLLLYLRITLLDRFLPDTFKALFPLKFALVYAPALLLLVLSNICFTLLYHEAHSKEATAAAPGASHR